MNATPQSAVRRSPPANVKTDDDVGKAAFIFYCIFIVSYFLHLGARVPAVGTMHADILLCGLAFVLGFGGKKDGPPGTQVKTPMHTVSKLLLAIVVYIIVTLPFVRWPGSVVSKGWEPFLKSVLFFVLTVRTVTTEKRLKMFLVTFLSVELFRVLEPLWLHITTGYWGSFTNMGNYELMDRLSGAPFDIVNPNGLAFVILVVVTLCHNILIKGTTKQKILYFAMLGPVLYAMMLTGSRSGFVALAIFALMVVWNSKRRGVALAVLAVACVALFGSMDDMERQRYLSIVDHSAKGGATSAGRIAGIWDDWDVGMQRPIFGHGLGTSLEANANARGEALPSHTLFTEVLQELGLLGLGLFVWFIVEACRNCVIAVRDSKKAGGFLLHAGESVRDFGIVLLFFSCASYGLNEPQWYLFAALSIVLRDLSRKRLLAEGAPQPEPSALGRRGMAPARGVAARSALR